MGFSRHHVLMVLPALFWAGNALIGRATVGQIPPIALSFWRWALALLIILPFTIRETLEILPVLRARWRLVVGLSLFSVTAYNTLLYLALQTTTAINATLVAVSMPVMMQILAYLWLGETLGVVRGLGIGLSLLGVLGIIVRGDPARLTGLSLTGGDLLVLVAVLSWAIYSVMLKRYPLPVRSFPLLTVLIAVGTVFILPFYLWELASGVTMEFQWSSVMAILYTSVFASLLAYYFWNQGMAALGAGVAGQYAYLMPLFTAILAVLLLGETFSWYHWAGGGLIFAGLWLSSRSSVAPGRSR